MIVVAIIGVLAALAVPAFKRVVRRQQNSQVANDLRVFSQAFETYATQNGSWPANAGAGVVPAGMRVGRLKNGVWQATTPIGGQWNWDDSGSGFSFNAGISITNFTCTRQQLMEIDIAIDDGDLNTGTFQMVAGNRMTLILE